MEMKVDQNKVRELRLAKSWSQEELAEAAAISLRTVQRMELDGSASLKSRRAVAEALGVEPVLLDCPIDEHASEVDRYHDVTPQESNKGFWRDLFKYPGPRSISNKIRTPLLVILWLGMMVTGGLIPIVFVSVTLLSLRPPGFDFSLVLIACTPLFVMFFFCLGLYAFFKRFSHPSSN